MRHIRPYKLFTALEAPSAGRIVQTAIPNRRAFGGLTLLETFIILAVARLVEAERIFEFGTFHGSTTLNLALNVSPNGLVFTLDLDNAGAATAVQDAADVPLTNIYLEGKESLDFIGTTVESRIHMLSGNSITFDFDPWLQSIDLVFVDGGHDLTTAQSDTTNAFRMTRRDKASCILWHDFQNPDYPALTGLLEDLSSREQIFHIEDTMLCVWFNALPGLSHDTQMSKIVR